MCCRDMFNLSWCRDFRVIPTHVTRFVIGTRLLPFEPIWSFASTVDSLEHAVFRHDVSVQLQILQSYMTINISGIFIVPTSSYATSHIAAVYIQMRFRRFLAVGTARRRPEMRFGGVKKVSNCRLRLHPRWIEIVDLNHVTKYFFK